jgi:hypothetical protein
VEGEAGNCKEDTVRLEERGGMPEIWFGKIKVMSATPGRPVIVLSKQERSTLERAAKIMERVREAMDPNGNEWWTEEYRVVALAEAYAQEAAALEYFEVDTVDLAPGTR